MVGKKINLNQMSSGLRRSETVCPLFGCFGELDRNQLPTIKEVITTILYQRNELKKKYNGKDPSNLEIYSLVSEEVIQIWNVAGIATVSKERVKQLLKKHHDKYRSLVRCDKKNQKQSYVERLKFFVNDSTNIFQIGSCKCVSSCVCTQLRPVLNETSQRKRNFFEKTNEESKIKIARITKNSSFNQLKLPTVAATCDRFKMSSRSAAAITSAVLSDIGLITKTDTRLVIDKNKIRRAISKSRCELKEVTGSTTHIESIYFDGRKDKTLAVEKQGSRFHRREIMEEHITILSEPESRFIGHVTPENGTGKCIAESVVNYLKDKYDMDKINCIGCDGTPTNTGWKNGAIQYFEKHLGKSLQWAVCLLHANELPLRHLFTFLDGSTSGPRDYSGAIGKALSACEKMPITIFEPVSGNMPIIPSDVAKELSCDQKYLYEICHSISSGKCTSELANRQPGKMAHSRWLTTANRILRIYVSTETPSQNLMFLVEYILKVYAPVWFAIKARPYLKDGALHFFNMVKFSRSLSANIKEIVYPVLKRNSFFVHPENLLLAMCYDSRDHVRLLSLERIIEARTSQISGIRIFKTPNINFDATDYINLINWNTVITPPPILSKYDDKELKEKVQSNQLPPCNIPCHSQAVERCVKIVTEASMHVIGENSRNGVIRNTLKSHLNMPKFDNKNDYKMLE